MLYHTICVPIKWHTFSDAQTFNHQNLLYTKSIKPTLVLHKYACACMHAHTHTGTHTHTLILTHTHTHTNTHTYQNHSHWFKNVSQK